MASNELWINLIIVFIVTVFFGYLLGLSVVKVVDHRLSDVSINMPKITLPRQNLYISLNKDPLDANKTHRLSSASHFSNLSGPSYQLNSPNRLVKPLKEGFVSSNQSGDDTDTDLMNRAVYQKDFAKPQMPTSPMRTDQLLSAAAGQFKTYPNQAAMAIDQRGSNTKDNQQCACDNQQTMPAVGCRDDADCNVVFGNGRNKCLSNHKCYCYEGSGLFCHYGPTYYKDPKDMTDRQRYKFKVRARFDKMTVQDYLNWLMLFDDDLSALAPRHLNNFLKVKKGIRLTLNDIPRDKIPPPMTAQSYFDQLYLLDDQVNIYSPQVSDTAGLEIPANYSDYTPFESPKNLKHLINRPLTLDQELAKSNDRGVLQTLQSRISYDWTPATDTSTEQAIHGRKPINEADHRYDELLRSASSNVNDDPSN